MPIAGPYTAPLPTPTGTPSDDHANLINDAIDEIRENLEQGVTSADISVETDLNFANHAAVNLGSMEGFSNLTAPAGTNLLYVRSGDWYAKDGSGNEIRITSGGSLAGASDLHGVRYIQKAVEYNSPTSGNTSANIAGGNATGSSGGATVFNFTGPSMRRGDRIVSVEVYCRHTNDGSAGTLQIQLFRRNDVAAQLVGTGSVACSASGPYRPSITGLTETVQADYSYFIRFTSDANIEVYTVTFGYDRVA
jgi:hypothetical protein